MRITARHAARASLFPAFGLLLVAFRSPSEAPQFALPVLCEAGRTCLVQKLVDHDPGPGRKDYRCGTLTTDGHDGIDIRLRTMQDMAKGYAVVAAAPGLVLRVRDGEPDISARLRTDRNGRDAGNGVVIDHGNGWETQYSHLKSGSVQVRPGQRVATGQQLGLIGMSGNSEFPHLHFSVRQSGQAVDPFTGGAVPGQCQAATERAALWSPDAARTLRYVSTAVIASGLASQAPARAVAERGAHPLEVARHAPLLLWVDVSGARDGDIQNFSITGPKGQKAHLQQLRVDGGGLSWFAFSGKKAPPEGWQAGRYLGHYTLKRGNQTVGSATTSIMIR